MEKTAIVYDEIYLKHETGSFHPESPKRLIDALDALGSQNFFEKGCTLQKPEKASLKDILLVHEEDYVEFVKFTTERGGYLDGDTPVSPGSFEAALYAAGGLTGLTDLILKKKFLNGFALVRPPGHHAGFNGKALHAPTAGFCVFNNIAIAAENLVRNRGIKRVLILDVDCHHGNGTEEIFYNRPDVLFISLHQDPRTLYPGTGFTDEIGSNEGEGFNINIPLPPKTGDDVYERALEEIILPVAEQFSPQFVLVSAGFDAHKADPITDMNLSANGYKLAFKKGLEIAVEKCSGRFAATLEGGYGKGLKSSLLASVSVMADIPYNVPEKETFSSENVLNKAERVFNELKNKLADYWSF